MNRNLDKTPISTAGKVAVIYARRSTGSSRQKESSLKEQISICRGVAAELGLVLPFDNYAEQHKGGGIRPRFQRLKQDILNGSINPDIIIVEKADRLSRENWDSYSEDMKPLQDAGKLLVIATGKMSGTPQRFIPYSGDVGEYIGAFIEQNQNAEFSESLADRISHRANQKAQDGKLFGKNIFGWDRRKTRDTQTDKVLSVEIVPNEDADIVKELFHYFSMNGNLLDLRPILRKSSKYPKKRCISCANKYRSSGLKLHGLAVSQDTLSCTRVWENLDTFENETCGCQDFEDIDIKGADIRSILRNPYHVGDYSYFKTNTGQYRQRINGKVVNIKRALFDNIEIPRRQNENPERAEVYIKNHHQGIIDRQTFDKVQEILDLNKTSNVNRGGKRKGVFTGILRCGCCGSNLTFRGTQGKPKYICDSSSRNKTNDSICKGGAKSILEETARKILVDFVSRELKSPRFWRIKLEEAISLVKQRELFKTEADPEEDEAILLEKIKQIEDNTKLIDLTKPSGIPTLQRLEEAKQELINDLDKLSNSRSRFNEDPFLEIVDKLDKDYSGLIKSKIPFLEWEVLDYEFDKAGHEEPKKVNVRELESTDNLSWSIPIYFLRDKNIPNNFFDCWIENYSLFSELTNGSYLHQLAIGYFIYSQYQEDLEHALDLVSVALAMESEKNPIPEDRVVDIVESCSLNFVSKDDYLFNQDSEIAKTSFNARYSFFIRSFSADLHDHSIGKQYHRSHNYCFTIHSTM